MSTRVRVAAGAPSHGVSRMWRFALDQNFPAPIADRFAGLFPRIQLVPVAHVDETFATLDDWELFLALHRHAQPWDGLITNDARLLALPKEMVVLSQTTLTLVVVEGEGGSPVKAVGLLLAHLSHVAHQSDPKRAQVWALRQSMKNAETPREFLEKIARREGTSVEALHRLHRIETSSRGQL